MSRAWGMQTLMKPLSHWHAEIIKATSFKMWKVFKKRVPTGCFGVTGWTNHMTLELASNLKSAHVNHAVQNLWERHFKIHQRSWNRVGEGGKAGRKTKWGNEWDVLRKTGQAWLEVLQAALELIGGERGFVSKRRLKKTNPDTRTTTILNRTVREGLYVCIVSSGGNCSPV